ncbi:hypothetical protein D5F01_LYC22384 [Larimichthys crocea]|uniref:Uncharacterized protein n=1 Tax=Larimichthys crocea TaxID=215358 RepID=A0A6G0HHU4_LARCR|nr:hypothetical protein D5F01_LYC22384 [Larimichthys crocea]
MQKQVDRSLLNIGSCGLHILHNSFREGCKTTGWDIEHTLSSLYWLFHDCPARHEDFVTATGCSTVMLKFCKHRWLENVTVTDRALKLWPYVQIYVERVLRGELPNPKTKSFETVKNSTKDCLFIPKVMIFNSIVREITPFLTLYQTDKPMLPFLSEDMLQLMKATFREFDPKTDRVDTLLYETMGTSKSFANVWHVVKMLLVLSHGQASVERGFSINKELVVENQKETSLIAQRLIVGHVRSVGGVTNVAITKELLLSVAGARQRYHSFLDDQKRASVKEMGAQKRKALGDELDELKKKRNRVKEDIGALEKSANNFADKAESTGNLTFIAKSNSLRRTAKDKRASLEEIEKQIDQKVAEMKDK